MRKQVKPDETGLTLVEILVGLLLGSVVAAGALTALAVHNRSHLQQNLVASMEQNLRVGMEAVTDAVRMAGYGVPSTGLTTWIPWVSGFATNPTIGTNEIKIARCTPMPVVTLLNQAGVGSTSLQVSSSVAGKTPGDLLNAGAKRLIFIGDSERAHVTAISGSDVTIDTNPAAGGNQGLSRAFASGTSICRVDVLTFKIETDPSTGVPQLRLNENQGAGSLPLGEGISALQVDTVTAGRRYTITMTGRTEHSDPMTGTMLTRRLVSDVAVRNAL